MSCPSPGSGRASSQVRNGDAVVAAIVHEEGLAAHPDLVAAGVALAAVVLDNHRLAAEAEAAARELQLSRARIAARAAQERRQIERDIHDGAQQRLVALGIELELTETLIQSDPERGLARLRELEEELGAAVEELPVARARRRPVAPRRSRATRRARARVLRSRFRVGVPDRGGGARWAGGRERDHFCLSQALQT